MTDTKRKALFKGIYKRTNEWAEGDLVHRDRDGSNRLIDFGIRRSDCYPSEVYAETVCRFTGMLDIFESDRVKITINEYYSNNHFCTEGDCTLDGVVVFDNYQWIVRFDDKTEISFSDIDYEDMEIVATGNIYDKKESK